MRRRGKNPSDPQDARAAAYAILEEWERGGRFLQDLLQPLLNREQLTPADKALATELACGTVRRKITLEHVLKVFCQHPWSRVQPGLKNLLRLGAYQLLFLERVPPSAAVNEAAGLARSRFGKGPAGFINAVLRNLVRDIIWSDEKDPGKSNHSLDCGSRVATFSRVVFPTFAENPVKHLHLAGGHPRWLVKRWVERLGAEKAQALCLANNQPAPLHLRWRVEEPPPPGYLPVPDCPSMVRAPRGGDPRKFEGFTEGAFQVQGLPSARTVLMLGVEPGAEVLDLCSAPGTKTMHLADLAGPAGRVFAIDKSLHRLGKLKENAHRLRIMNVSVLAGDATEASAWLKKRFCRILLDAPCSNTGELSRRIDVRHRIRPGDIRALAAVQQKLLGAAALVLLPAGKLVYSTCSLEQEEGSEVVQQFLHYHPDFCLEEECWFLPQEYGGAGGYSARIVRAGPST